jgi:hypothetical protein
MKARLAGRERKSDRKYRSPSGLGPDSPEELVAWFHDAFHLEKKASRKLMWARRLHEIAATLLPYSLSSILSAIEGHPRAVNAFMDFLHSLQVEKQASHQAAQRFEAFAERMQEEMRGLKEAIRELSGSLHYSRAFAPRIDVLPAPARQLPRPRKIKPKKIKRRKHR